VDVLEGITFFGAYFGNIIFWGGRRYSLLPDGTLELKISEPPLGKSEPVVTTKN
jgi:hypothetical protein